MRDIVTPVKAAWTTGRPVSAARTALSDSGDSTSAATRNPASASGASSTLIAKSIGTAICLDSSTIGRM